MQFLKALKKLNIRQFVTLLPILVLLGCSSQSEQRRTSAPLSIDKTENIPNCAFFYTMPRTLKQVEFSAASAARLSRLLAIDDIPSAQSLPADIATIKRQIAKDRGRLQEMNSGLCHSRYSAEYVVSRIEEYQSKIEFIEANYREAIDNTQERQRLEELTQREQQERESFYERLDSASFTNPFMRVSVTDVEPNKIHFSVTNINSNRIINVEISDIVPYDDAYGGGVAFVCRLKASDQFGNDYSIGKCGGESSFVYPGKTVSYYVSMQRPVRDAIVKLHFPRHTIDQLKEAFILEVPQPP